MNTIRTIQLAFASVLLASAAVAQTTPSPVGLTTARTNPYNLTGRVTFSKQSGGSYIGSATVIRPYSVVTAAHCMYDRDGWSKNVRFERGRYDNVVTQTSSATRLWVLGGYTGAVAAYGRASSQAFNRDLGGFTCSTRPANGAYAGWWQDTTLLTGPTYNMSLGYGGAVHNGKQLLRSVPTRTFTQAYGSWFTNSSYGIEGGMSGGPVFAYKNSAWWVCAVNVSGPVGNINTGGGVRALDTDAVNLIRNNLY